MGNGTYRVNSTVERVSNKTVDGKEIAENLIDKYDILPENTVRTPYEPTSNLRDHNYIYQRFKSMDWSAVVAGDAMAGSLIELSSNKTFTHIRSSDVEKILYNIAPELKVYFSDYDYIDQRFRGTVYFEGAYNKLVIENDISGNELIQGQNRFVIENELERKVIPTDNTIDRREYEVISVDISQNPPPVLFVINDAGDEIVDDASGLAVYKHDWRSDGFTTSQEYTDFLNHSVISLTTTEAEILKKRAVRNQEQVERLKASQLQSHVTGTLATETESIVTKINDLDAVNSIVLAEKAEDIVYNDLGEVGVYGDCGGLCGCE